MKNQDVDPVMDSVPVNDLQDMQDKCTLLVSIAYQNLYYLEFDVLILCWILFRNVPCNLI